MISDRS